MENVKKEGILLLNVEITASVICVEERTISSETALGHLQINLREKKRQKSKT